MHEHRGHTGEPSNRRSSIGRAAWSLLERYEMKRLEVACLHTFAQVGHRRERIESSTASQL